MRRGFRRLALLAAVLAVLAGASPASAAAAGRYVAIGDSIAAASDSYVDRFAVRLGIADVHKLMSGDTAVQAVKSELPAALALIGDGTDTTVVTLQIGGHDYLSGNCNGDWNRPTCDFADGFHTLVSGLRGALDLDPGAERFLIVAYYNPASGLGGAREQSFDAGLRGTDARIDTSAHGDAWGLTDVTGWLTCRSGATFVDPWAVFKAGGQSLMSDSLHPNATGQAVLTDLLGDPAAGGPAPTCPATTPFAVTDADTGDGRAHGVVEPRLAAARWWFEYGSTTAYGSATSVGVLAPSAGPRAVEADLPASRPNGTFHVRLVVENERGKAAGQDRVVTMPGPPELDVSLRGRALRRILARGIALRIHSTGHSIAVRGRMRRPGHDPLVLGRRLPWQVGATRTVRVQLSARGRRLVRRATRPRLALVVTADGPGGVSEPVRLALRPR